MAALLNDLKTQGGSSVLVVLDVVCDCFVILARYKSKCQRH